MKGLAVVLIVIGIVGLAYGGITWTKRDKVLDVGPVQVTHDKKESVPVPPILGGICLVGGIGLLLSMTRRSQSA